MATEIELETDGNVWKLLVAEGDTVEEGQMLFIMEVMKMEHQNTMLQIEKYMMYLC